MWNRLRGASAKVKTKIKSALSQTQTSEELTASSVHIEIAPDEIPSRSSSPSLESQQSEMTSQSSSQSSSVAPSEIKFDTHVDMQISSEEFQKRASGFFGLIGEIRRKIHKYTNDDRLEKVNNLIGKLSETLNSVQKEIDEISERPHNESDNPLLADGSLKNSVAILVEAASRGKSVVEEVIKANFSRNPFTFMEQAEPILEKLSLALDIIPLAIETFDKSGIDELLPTQAPSVDVVQQAVSQQLTKIAQRALQKYTSHQHKLEFLKAFKFSNDKDTLDRFRKLPRVVQHGMLVAMQEINSELEDLVLLLDEVEIRFDFKEGKLLDRIKLKLQFDESSPFHQLSINNRTLKEFCQVLANSYQERMSICKFITEDELFPFEDAKYYNRKALREEVASTQRTTLKEYHDRVLMKGLDDAIAYIKKIKKDNRLVGLCSWLEEHQKSENLNLTSVLIKLKEEQAKLGQDKHLINVIRIFIKIQSYCANKNESINALIERFDGKIAKRDEADKNLAPQLRLANRLPIERTTRHEALIASLRTTVESVKKLVVGKFLKPAVPVSPVAIENPVSVPASESTDTAQAEATDVQQSTVATPQASGPSQPERIEESQTNTLAAALAVTDAKLRKYLDPEVYQRFFVEPQDAATIASTDDVWIKELGQTYLSAKRLIDVVGDVIDEFVPGNKNNRHPYKTPSMALAGTVDTANRALEVLDDLATAVDKLHTDPFLRDCFKALHNVIRLGPPSPVETHPWYQFIRNDGKQMLNGIVNAQYKLNGALREIHNNLDKLIIPFQRLDVNQRGIPGARMRDAAHETLYHMRRITEDLSPMLHACNPSPFMSAGGLSFYDYLELVFKHVGSVYNVLNNLSLAFDALDKAARDQMMLMITELLNIFKNTYLFLDRVETLFYLKQGSLTNSRHPMGITLLGDRTFAETLKFFQDKIQELDFPLMPEQRVPYSYAVYNQGQRLLQAVEEKPAEITKRQFIAKRVEKQKADFLLETFLSNKEKYREIPRTYALSRINARIRKLRNKRWTITSVPTLKIKLLTMLQKEIKTKPLVPALRVIEKHGYLGKYMDLLFDGETGNMMREINTAMMPANAIATRIQQEIDRLEIEKEKRTLLIRVMNLFSSKDRKTRMQEAIVALTALRACVMDRNLVLEEIHKEKLLEHEPELFSEIKIWSDLQDTAYEAAAVSKKDTILAYKSANSFVIWQPIAAPAENELAVVEGPSDNPPPAIGQSRDR